MEPERLCPGVFTFDFKYDVYLHTNNQLHSELISWDSTKVLQTCLGTLGMPNQTHLKTLSTSRKLWCLSACIKSTTSLTAFLRY